MHVCPHCTAAAVVGLPGLWLAIKLALTKWRARNALLQLQRSSPPGDR